MTTKRNFLRMPGNTPGPPLKPRIVIEIDPVKGGSLLKTYGPVTFPMVIDALIAQHASVWKQWIAGLTTAVTDPHTGQPVIKSPEDTPMPESEPGEDDRKNKIVETETMRQTPHDHTFQGDE